MDVIILNHARASTKDLALLGKALSTPAIVREKGGYLFKSRVEGQTFHFGILPNFMGGERSHHYDIEISPSAYNLIGSINANRTLTAVFKRDRAKIGHPLSEEERGAYRGQYAQLARFLIDRGLPPAFALDATSIAVLEEAELLGSSPATTIGHLLADPPQS